MEAFSIHLMWVAAATHTAVLSPTGLTATMQGIIGGLHYGLGRGSGSFLGGYLIDTRGTRSCFKIVALMAAVCGALYFLFDSHRRRRRAEEANIRLLGNSYKKKKESLFSFMPLGDQSPTSKLQLKYSKLFGTQRPSNSSKQEEILEESSPLSAEHTSSDDVTHTSSFETQIEKTDKSDTWCEIVDVHGSVGGTNQVTALGGLRNKREGLGYAPELR